MRNGVVGVIPRNYVKKAATSSGVLENLRNILYDLVLAMEGK
jgi:hypothetical protein